MELQIGKVPVKEGPRGPGRPRTIPHVVGCYCFCARCRMDRKLTKEAAAAPPAKAKE